MRGDLLQEVIVVGAGPAGLLVTEQLRALGHDVLLLEAGPRAYPNPSLLPGQVDPKEQALEQPPNTRVASDAEEPAEPGHWRHRLLGAKGWWARAHALGGRGNLWGGWLTRFDAQVFAEGRWPYGARTLAADYRSAERWLGAARGVLVPHFTQLGRELGLPIRPGLFATRLGPGLESDLAASARTHNIVVRLEPGARAHALRVLQQGRERTLRARAVVLAASPIESARLLLESELGHPALGRRLTDHSMLGFVLYEPQRAAVRLPGPLARATALIPRFVNLPGGPARRYHGGYTLELMGPLPLEHLGALQRQVLGLGAERTGSVTYITAIGEQWQHRERFVDLAPRARDALGRRVPQIRFAWSAAERRMVEDMKDTCRDVAHALASPGAELTRLRDPFVHPAIFHPAGTCFMGAEASSPCDPHGALRATPRVWLADASVFPSGGDTHPTLTVLAHALRVARSVHATLSVR
jgi:choline dehydrogenase-like flavoprotein